jgi:CheY-like chemotaxis protein
MPQTHPHVLIVDDHPKVLRVIQLGLKVRGYIVSTMQSGVEALEAVRAEPPDVMILDVRMPEMDGFELLIRLREFSQVPVIA